jgi:hypothetical protein
MSSALVENPANELAHFRAKREEKASACSVRNDVVRDVVLSEVARSVLHGAVGKRDYGGLSDFFGEGVASLAACGRAARMVSVFLAVDPLKQDVE